MIKRIASVAGLLLCSLAGPARPDADIQGPYDRLLWPVDCILGQDCFIQNYLDRDPGPGLRDIGCGRLTYDGHKGTDISLPSIRAQRAGVDVRAAAAGTVQGQRDGMPDILQGQPDAPRLDGQDCGNGVAIRQQDGLLALYCHLKRGSVTVAEGDRVAKGETLGQIGLSGNTTFPHLHFELLEGETPLDPFAPSPVATDCRPDKALWIDAVPYVPGGLIAVGLTAEIPDYSDIKFGLPIPRTLGDPPRLIAWGFGFGARIDDVLALRITGPRGVLLDEQIVHDRSRAQFYYYFGLPRATTGWTGGTYTGEVTMLRGDGVLDRKTVQTRID